MDQVEEQTQKIKTKNDGHSKEVTAVRAQSYFYMPRGLQCIPCLQ